MVVKLFDDTESTELYTLNGQILQYVNFIYIKMFFKKQSKNFCSMKTTSDKANFEFINWVVKNYYCFFSLDVL